MTYERIRRPRTQEEQAQPTPPAQEEQNAPAGSQNHSFANLPLHGQPVEEAAVANQPQQAEEVASNSAAQVAAGFDVKPYFANTIREYKANNTVLGNGWDAGKIDQLLAWSKSEGQFLSYINNMRYDIWQILAEQFSGSELPRKADSKNVNQWVQYQQGRMNTEVYPTQFVGYKGSGGTQWNGGENFSDWSGCYIATTQEQAEGYIGEAGMKSGKASMWKITLKKPLPVRTFSGGFIDNSNISGEFKALVLKKVLGIQDAAKLIEQMGKSGFAYLGPGGEDGQELVVPWGLVPEYVSYQRITEYDVTKFGDIRDQREIS